MRSWKAIASSGLTLALAGWLCTPTWAQAQQAANAAPAPSSQQRPAAIPSPGMLNYVEGQVTVAGQPVKEGSVGTVRLQAGQTLAAQNGRAEMLLTPGVMLRLDDNSAVMMDTSGIPDTVVALESGRAMVEADQVLSANHIIINEGPASVRLMTHGLYDFDATHGIVRVFDGRAKVTVAGKTHTLQKGHEFDLNAPKLKARGFDKKAEEDAFYRWSSLRSAYLAEANVDAARGVAQGYYGSPYPYGAFSAYYPGWYDTGWYWDPYFDAYTWMPWDGAFFSPFGFGFYSPAFVYAAPFYGYGGYGFRGGGYHRFGPGFRPSVAAHPGGSARIAGNGFSGVRGGGFARGFGAGGVRGGGFARGGGVRSGGGGGFHGGGGGFHGGGGSHGGGGRR